MIRRFVLFFVCAAASAQTTPARWVTAWAGSVQGPYPTGNASAQPHLEFAFPQAATGANDQTFRMIVRPDVWGAQARIRLSNVFGTRSVTFDGVFAGVQLSGAAVLKGTNRPVTFSKKASVTIAPGEFVWSDSFAAGGGDGRKLAISFHVAGTSGPMTWHAKALTTSYLSAPGAGSKGGDESEASFPYSTTSWYFVDAVEMTGPAHTIVAFGDSITDGTASTLNGDDRWPDVFSRRVHAAFGNQFSVVNAGIGGNRVVGPETYSAAAPFSGGPSALQRLDRDVLGLSNVSAVIWLEGINDFNKTNGASLEAVEAGMKEGVARMRAKIPGIRVIGATLTSSVGYAGGSPEQEQKRRALNAFIRTSKLFDGVADFDKATADPQTGALRAEFVPDSTTGGAGDHLHPNRAGYEAMGMSVPLSLLSK